MNKNKFWSWISNGKYVVGCTGQTVYIYDTKDYELGAFKDMRYAYLSMFHPTRNEVVVKSVEGLLGIYNLDEMRLVKKFRFAKTYYSQDEGMCFSHDGRFLYNIEHVFSAFETVVSVYNTETYMLEKRLFKDYSPCMLLNAIEYSEKYQCFFVLGYFRDEKTGIANRFFVTKLIQDELKEIRYIDESIHTRFLNCNDVRTYGNTEKRQKWLNFMGKKTEDFKMEEASFESLWENS